MEIITILKAILLGFIEGLTEFLPISSTGHIILVSHWIQFQSTEAKVFEVVIQFGAILAVFVMYRRKILRITHGLFTGKADAVHFSSAVIIAFLPAAVLGALFISHIKAYLFNPTVVAIMLVLGGIVILWVERWQKQRTVPVLDNIEAISFKQALVIGLAQCLAMIPGTSRSGATIVGGLWAGLSRSAATEFSFFLAIPTMLGATVLDLAKHHHLLQQSDWVNIACGFVATFVTAWLVVKWMVAFVARHSLAVFAYYRIAFGLLLMALMVF